MPHMPTPYPRYFATGGPISCVSLSGSFRHSSIALPNLGIGRAEVRHLRALHEVVLVVQRLGLEAPVGLEVEGSGAALAAAIVEDAAALFACALHHLPVHEVVAGHCPGFLRAAAVVRQHLVAEVEIEHARDGAVALQDRDDLAGLAEYVLEHVQVAPAKTPAYRGCAGSRSTCRSDGRRARRSRRAVLP